MGEEAGAEVRKVADTRPDDLDGFDLVGFGSGIDGFRVYPELTAFVSGLPDRKGQHAFIFSTCASNKDLTGKFRSLLAAKGFHLAGEYHCGGLWTPLFFKIRKGHPNEEDQKNARAFIRKIQYRGSPSSRTDAG